MKTALILSILLANICFGHTISQDGLWKGYAVSDSAGNEIRYKRQDFIKIKGDTILLFQFNELMSRKTGEVIIKTVIDTLTILPSEINGIYKLLYKSEILMLEIKGENEFQIIFPKFILTFKKIPDLVEFNLTIEEYQNFIIGSKFLELDPQTKEKRGNLSHAYQNNGKAKYQETNSHSNWESAFMIVDFEGYIFLKGITSAPILLTGIKGFEIKGLEVDYRFDPKKIILSKSIDLFKFNPEKSIIVKPFEIKPADISNLECINKLTKSQLSLEVNLAKGITEKKFPTVQVQHSYGCNWMLFHGHSFDGYTKTTVEKLLIIDSTICFILDIPCGYYAERNSKEDPWHIYLHEERIETDSSYIIKKAFKWDNTYRIINEIKNKKLVHYEDYYLDSRVLKKTWTFLESKEVGVTRYYDEKGNLVKEVNNNTGETINY